MEETVLVKDILQETVLVKHNPWVIKSVVNGFVATAIIWAFWCPFMLVIAVPLANAMVKDFLCDFADLIPGLIQGSLGTAAEQAYINSLPAPPSVAAGVIEHDKTQFLNENTILYFTYSIISFLIVIGSFVIANYLMHAYNIDTVEIINYNIAMAIMIALVEMIFFTTVTTEYIPFDIQTIAKKIRDKIHAEFGPYAQ